jgi:hypothetical protein
MGSPGSPPVRVTTVCNKWVRPIRRLADLIMGSTDLICDPEDLQKTLSDTLELRIHVKTSVA